MKTSTRCCVRAAVLAIVLAGSSTVSAAAQGDVSLTGGSGVYESDAFCLDTNATFSVIEVSGGGDLVGASVAYSNGAWPWTGPPPAAALGLGPFAGGVSLNREGQGKASRSRAFQEEAFLTNGDAVRIMAETFPVAFLSRLPGQREGTLGDINRYVRPFIGAGLHISGDGETAPPGNGRELPTFGLEGSTNFILSYGARVYLPGRDMPVRAVLSYRGNTMFVSDVVYRTPDNGTLRGDGETLTWGEWGIGLSLRIGG